MEYILNHPLLFLGIMIVLGLLILVLFVFLIYVVVRWSMTNAFLDVLEDIGVTPNTVNQINGLEKMRKDVDLTKQTTLKLYTHFVRPRVATNTQNSRSKTVQKQPTTRPITKSRTQK